MDIVFTSGKGKLATQSIYLSRSIRSYGNFDQSFVFIPESEIQNIDGSILRELEGKHSIITEDIPIPDYPISAKIQGLIEAQRRGESEYTLLVDTDTMVLNNIRMDVDSDLLAVPINIATDKYWTSSDSQEDWEALYDRFGLEIPEHTITTVVDQQKIRPYYNAGVVIARDAIGEQWLDWTEEVFQFASDSKKNADQVALGLLSQDVEFQELDKKYNYPTHSIKYPSKICILHYFDLSSIIRVRNEDVRGKIRYTGAYDSINTDPTIWALLYSSHGYKPIIRSKIGRWIKRSRLPSQNIVR